MEEKMFFDAGETTLLPLPVAKAIAESPAALVAFDSLSESDMTRVLKAARYATSVTEIENIVKNLEGM